jgi:hypothetical protein
MIVRGGELVSEIPDKIPQTERGMVGEPSVPELDNRWITDGAPSDNLTIITRDGRGRFRKGTVANPTGLFRKGCSGNPKGRPPGSGRFRDGARLAAALLDAEAERIARTNIDAALAGDAVAARYCLGRILGVRRGQPVELAMPPVAGAGDLSAAVAAITGAVAEGRVTPDEALALSQMLDGLPRVFAAVPVPPKQPSAAEAGAARHRLIEGLGRLAERHKQQHDEAAEQATLRQSQALATIPLSSRVAGGAGETGAAPPEPRSGD